MAEQSSEKNLVKLAQSGDKQSVETLLENYKNLVRCIARQYILPGGETEDLIQEGMIGLSAAISGYSEDKGMSFKNFACLCVKRKIFDAVKKYNGKKNQPMNGYVSLIGWEEPLFSDPEEEVLQSERSLELWKLVGKALSHFEFHVFKLYLEGLSSEEICEAIGKDSKSVDNAVQRSKKKLRAAISAEKKS